MVELEAGWSHMLKISLGFASTVWHTPAPLIPILYKYGYSTIQDNY